MNFLIHLAVRCTLSAIVVSILGWCGYAHSMSFKGGHELDYKGVLETIEGENFNALIKSVSNAVDSDLPKAISELSGEPVSVGKHRYFGHWGFEGSIPFESEPYKEYLSRFSRKDVIRAWTEMVNRLTNEAMELTGLPKRQARALVGLIYDTHLLGDWKPDLKTNRILDPLLHPEKIRADILKNLHRLFGNNSLFVKELETKLISIKVKDPQLFAQKVLDVLREKPIGQKLFAAYGKTLTKNGMKHVQVAESNVRAIMKNPRTFKLKADIKTFDGYDDIARQIESSGASREVIVKPGLVLPGSRVLLSLGEGLQTGLAVFAMEGGLAGYHRFQGNTWRPQFEREIKSSLIKGTTVGAATAVAVFLGASPGGFVVLAVASGSYIAVDFAVRKWHECKDRQFVTAADLAAFGIDVSNALGPSGQGALDLEAWDTGSLLDVESWNTGSLLDIGN
jgi:hypothetical protein